MCIVIDANVFSSIANKEASTHAEFRPLIQWISSGKGKIVFGGTKYGEEVAKNRRYSEWLVELERNRKIVPIDHKLVDPLMDFLADTVSGPDYDDHHIVSILLVSGCRLVCSEDKGLHSLIYVCYQPQLKKLVTDNCPNVKKPIRPKIYQKKKHSPLLCDENIAECCR